MNKTSAGPRKVLPAPALRWVERSFLYLTESKPISAMQELKIDDIVWAKMGKTNPWPAKIARPTPRCLAPNIRQPQHFIYFYGTHNYAWLRDKKIKLHSEKELHKYRQSKKPAKSLVLAVNELLNELQEDEPLEETGHDLKENDAEKEEEGKKSKKVTKQEKKKLHEKENKQKVNNRREVKSMKDKKKKKELETEEKKRVQRYDKKGEQTKEKKRVQEKDKKGEKTEKKQKLLEKKNQIEENKSKMLKKMQRQKASDEEKDRRKEKELDVVEKKRVQGKTEEKKNNKNLSKENIKIQRKRSRDEEEDSSPSKKPRNETPQLPEDPEIENSSIDLSIVKPEPLEDLEDQWNPGNKLVGFICYDEIGSQFISRLIFSGHKLILWNPSGDMLEEFAGRAQIAKSYRELVERSDITLNFLCSGAETKQHLTAAFPENNSKVGSLDEDNQTSISGSALPLKNKGFVEMSAISLENAEFLSKYISILGGNCLMATINGSFSLAEEQCLRIMASGSLALFKDCIPCFRPVSKTWNFLGEDPKAASIVKMMYTKDVINKRAQDLSTLLTMATSKELNFTDF